MYAGNSSQGAWRGHAGAGESGPVRALRGGLPADGDSSARMLCQQPCSGWCRWSASGREGCSGACPTPRPDPAVHPPGVAGDQSKNLATPGPLPAVVSEPMAIGWCPRASTATAQTRSALTNRISAGLPGERAGSGRVDKPRSDREVEHDRICAAQLRRDGTRTPIVHIAARHH